MDKQERREIEVRFTGDIVPAANFLNDTIQDGHNAHGLINAQIGSTHNAVYRTVAVERDFRNWIGKKEAANPGMKITSIKVKK